MTYIGTPAQSGFITTAKQRVTSSTNNYVDLDHSISSIADVIVFVNFVKQDTTNLTLTTSTRITLGDTLQNSDIVEIHYLGKAVNTTTVSDGSLGLSKLSATGTKSSSTFLRGDNTFAAAGLANWSENSGNLLPSNASYGVYLGVNSATAANLLDHYEEGTWTPRLQGRSTAGTFNYDSGGGDGFYQRIGEIVHVWFWLSGSLSGGSGELQISGLPYNMSGGQTQYREMVGAQNFSGRNPAFISKFNNTTWECYERTGNQSDSGVSQTNSSTGDVGGSSVQMWGSMTYKTA